MFYGVNLINAVFVNSLFKRQLLLIIITNKRCQIFKNCETRKDTFSIGMLKLFIHCFQPNSYNCFLKRHKPSFSVETLPMDFTPDDGVGMKEGWLLRHHFLLDVLHENSFLLLGLLCRLGNLSSAGIFLFDVLNDTDGHSLLHVTHSKTPWEGEIDSYERLKRCNWHNWQNK